MAGIYIHIPFCKQACHYCDFHFSISLLKKNDLILALIRELELRKNEFENICVETIYFGGGTPSLLLPTELNQILDAIYKHYTVVNLPEITLEVNPDDLIKPSTQSSKENLKAYKDIGINRLSIGVQSFFDSHLSAMNRAHSGKEAQHCLELATAFFDNITIDLIYGIPTMTDAEWDLNLKTSFGFNIPHISSYALTIEPKTALNSFIQQGKYPDVSQEQAFGHFQHLIKQTAKAGFVHYEISNFGKPDYFSKHNTAYWLGKPYLGIGPSAHSFNILQRSWNVSNNSKYIKALASGKLPKTTETLEPKDVYNEYVMTGLRTIWGVSLKSIESQFGVSVKASILEEAQKYINQGVLTIEAGDTLKITEKGKFLADRIASDLFMI